MPPSVAVGGVNGKQCFPGPASAALISMAIVTCSRPSLQLSSERVACLLAGRAQPGPVPHNHCFFLNTSSSTVAMPDMTPSKMKYPEGVCSSGMYSKFMP